MAENDGPAFRDSPLRPRTDAQWLMPALSARLLSPHPAGKWYAGRRTIVVRSFDGLRAVLDDAYVAGICGILAGDYVNVRIDGDIDFPVETIRADGKDGASASWTVTAGIVSRNDYRHRLVFRGGRLRIAFRHTMAAREEIRHGRLGTTVRACFFENLRGVTFIGTAFELSGRVDFDDASERRGARGENNAPKVCAVDASKVACFLGCSGVSLVECSALCRMEVDNV